jgi:hypothetical protein
VRGSARLYKPSLITDDRLDGVSHQSQFTPAAPQWQVLPLAPASFSAAHRGRPVLEAPPPDPARIRQVGLTIVRRQAGRFALDTRRLWLA